MLAAVYRPGERNLELTQIARPSPGPGEVLLKVLACGVCHSDVFVLDVAGSELYKNSFTMGHEACGEVVALGDGAQADVGGIYCVHVTSMKACGPPALQLENVFGLGLNGGYAEYAVVPQAALVRVPAGVRPAIAAVCSDAGTTAHRAVHAVAHVRAGQRVLVIGAGGLGLIGVQLAIGAGASEVSVCDLRQHSLALASSYGATRTFSPADLDAAIKEGFEVDVVIDFVSNPKTFSAAREALRTAGKRVGGSGRLVIVGVGHEDVKFNLMDAILTPFEIVPTLYGAKDDLESILRMVAEGKVQLHVQDKPLEEINSVLDQLRQGSVESRMVVIPKHS
ncbi:GroES-like protein [Auricularia subglabra TFB-10046 SS5]|nr:GroES-like protein [Auricularia subglabra TFB-10046 SS5]